MKGNYTSTNCSYVYIIKTIPIVTIRKTTGTYKVFSLKCVQWTSCIYIVKPVNKKWTSSSFRQYFIEYVHKIVSINIFFTRIWCATGSLNKQLPLKIAQLVSTGDAELGQHIMYHTSFWESNWQSQIKTHILHTVKPQYGTTVHKLWWYIKTLPTLYLNVQMIGYCLKTSARSEKKVVYWNYWKNFDNYQIILFQMVSQKSSS